MDKLRAVCVMVCPQNPLLNSGWRNLAYTAKTQYIRIYNPVAGFVFVQILTFIYIYTYIHSAIWEPNGTKQTTETATSLPHLDIFVLTSVLFFVGGVLNWPFCEQNDIPKWMFHWEPNKSWKSNCPKHVCIGFLNYWLRDVLNTCGSQHHHSEATP